MADSEYRKIAEEAVAQAERLEQINILLRDQLTLMKKASASTEQIQSTVQELFKCGCLQRQELAQAAQLLASDNNAALRVIKGFCVNSSNAQTLSKQASNALNCGQLVNSTVKKTQSYSGDAWQAVRKVFASH